jgi:hypothetical protein
MYELNRKKKRTYKTGKKNRKEQAKGHTKKEQELKIKQMQTRNAAAAVARSAYAGMLSLRPFMQLHPTPLRDMPRSSIGPPRPPAAGALVQVQVQVSGDVLASCL